ncbi:MAG TPA: hypothetical protein VG101_00225 [Puia sp.]|jgi:hypothetical protein|nr:hypothetical protein [Puia sp.]
MKIPGIFLVAIGLSTSALAQSRLQPQSPPPAQSTFNDSLACARNHVTKTAMLTLGSWAVANITSGFIVAGQTSGTTKYAWQMNAYWNFVNLGLAGMGYLRAVKEAHKTYSLLENYDAQNALEKIYLFNLGLDLGYIGGGLYLRERGMNSANSKTSAQLQGYGTSIVIQGGFLLLMDGVMILIHRHNTQRVRQHLSIPQT